MTEATRTAEPYRVSLENYFGPLDLLLHLVREKELPITDVALAQVADQYLAYVQALQKLDVGMSGEFLVIASTLMEIKARTLVPREVEEEEEPFDPKLELIRRLLEYRRYKEASRRLAELWDRRQLRAGRAAGPQPEGEEEEEGPPVELDLWALAKAWARLSRETRLDVPVHILYDDVPIERLMEEILRRLREAGKVLLSQLVPDRSRQALLIGNFLAALELARQQRVRVQQAVEFGEIELSAAAGCLDG